MLVSAVVENDAWINVNFSLFESNIETQNQLIDTQTESLLGNILFFRFLNYFFNIRIRNLYNIIIDYFDHREWFRKYFLWETQPEYQVAVSEPPSQMLSYWFLPTRQHSWYSEWLRRFQWSVVQLILGPYISGIHWKGITL